MGHPGESGLLTDVLRFDLTLNVVDAEGGLCQVEVLGLTDEENSVDFAPLLEEPADRVIEGGGAGRVGIDGQRRGGC